MMLCFNFFFLVVSYPRVLKMDGSTHYNAVSRPSSGLWPPRSDQLRHSNVLFGEVQSGLPESPAASTAAHHHSTTTILLHSCSLQAQSGAPCFIEPSDAVGTRLHQSYGLKRTVTVVSRSLFANFWGFSKFFFALHYSYFY